MQVIRSVPALRSLVRRWQRQPVSIGLVPTMGYLHAGHLSLVHKARRQVGSAGKVVLSIYVNPTQFGPGEDFSRYPRDLKRDLMLCRQAGVDAVFVPTDAGMYPGRSSGRFSTYVVEETLSSKMEGKSRPDHFRGVTTIVAKLFNLVQPGVAVFGSKDGQQAAIIKRMVKDLNFPVRLIVAPTVRESDGVAMSSRNKYLSAAQRLQARVLSQSIKQARQWVVASQRGMAARKLALRVAKLVSQSPDARLDYVEFFDPETLLPKPRVTRGTQMALAVFIGSTRLIDNGRL